MKPTCRPLLSKKIIWRPCPLSSSVATRLREIQLANESKEQILSTVSNGDSETTLMRIIVVLGNRKNKVVVNIIQADGSSKSYVNSDVIFQSETYGTVQRIRCSFKWRYWKLWV